MSTTIGSARQGHCSAASHAHSTGELPILSWAPLGTSKDAPTLENNFSCAATSPQPRAQQWGPWLGIWRVLLHVQSMEMPNTEALSHKSAMATTSQCTHVLLWPRETPTGDLQTTLYAMNSYAMNYHWVIKIDVYLPMWMDHKTSWILFYFIFVMLETKPKVLCTLNKHSITGGKLLGT